MPTSPGIISNTPGREYFFARLNKENLKDLGRLYLEVHAKAVAADYFFRKYDTGYTGVEDAGFIAYDRRQKPVAFYGVIPCFIQYKKDKILVAQAADAMTHPQHRSKGLFMELSNLSFDLCRQLGIRLCFGFPNQNSSPVMVSRLGWIETEKMNRFSISLTDIPGVSFFQNKTKRRKEILNKMLSPRETLPNSVLADGFAGIYRDEAYHHYKTFTKTCVIRTGSADVWIKIAKELIVGDIMLNENGGNDFFEEVEALAKQLYLKKISFQVCTGCRLHGLFASRYKPVPSFPVLFKDFGSGLPLEKIKFTFADIDVF